MRRQHSIWQINEALNGLVPGFMTPELLEYILILTDAINELELLRPIVQAARALDTYEDFGEQMATCEHCGKVCITNEHQIKRRALYEALQEVQP